jgi:hypothetical protein
MLAYSISDVKSYIDITQVDLKPRMPVGTRLVKEDCQAYRYACAGEDLQKGVFIEPGLSVEDTLTLAFSQKIEKFADIVYGKVKATIGDPEDKTGILGWPVVAVKKGHYFWIQEMPIGATLVKGEKSSA